MVVKKTTMVKAAKSEQTEPKFSREQIVASKKYRNHMDFLKGNLADTQEYSLREVDALIETYMKGQVK